MKTFFFLENTLILGEKYASQDQTSLFSQTRSIFILINLLWGSVNNGQPLHELHNNKSLRTPGIEFEDGVK